MTQVQSIQANIDYAQSHLNKMLALVPTNEVEKHHFAGSIREYKREISQLKRCLKFAIEQSK